VVLCHRTPYGSPRSDGGPDKDAATEPGIAERRRTLFRGSILRRIGAKLTRHGYVAVLTRHTRGRTQGSEGADRVLRDDAADGFDTLDWIGGSAFGGQRDGGGMSGSSAGAKPPPFDAGIDEAIRGLARVLWPKELLACQASTTGRGSMRPVDRDGTDVGLWVGEHTSRGALQRIAREGSFYCRRPALSAVFCKIEDR